MAEDIHDAVVADAVSGAEEGVGVIVEGAPSDAAGGFHCGDLVMDMGMMEGMLFGAFFLVEGFGGEHVAAEFGIEVLGCSRGFEFIGEVVHGIDIFEEFAVPDAADAAGLSGGVEGSSEGVGSEVEVVVVRGFIDADAPEDDGGVISVAEDHGVDIAEGEILPGLVSDVLPAGDFLEDEEADLVAAVEEMGGLGVVAGADDIAGEFVFEDVGVFVLHSSGCGLSDIREGLVPIESAEFEGLFVEVEGAIVAELCGAETDAGGDGIAVVQGDGEGVEDGVVEIPAVDIAEVGEGELGVDPGVGGDLDVSEGTGVTE